MYLKLIWFLRWIWDNKVWLYLQYSNVPSVFYEMSLFVHQTDGDDKVLGVWTGVKVCQDLHQLAEDLYPGDAGCDDAAPPLSAAAAVQNLRHRPHGHSCTGVPIK